MPEVGQGCSYLLLRALEAGGGFPQDLLAPYTAAALQLRGVSCSLRYKAGALTFLCCHCFIFLLPNNGVIHWRRKVRWAWGQVNGPCCETVGSSIPQEKQEIKRGLVLLVRGVRPSKSVSAVSIRRYVVAAYRGCLVRFDLS